MFILGLFRLAHLFSELLLMPCSPRMDSRSVLLLSISRGAKRSEGRSGLGGPAIHRSRVANFPFINTALDGRKGGPTSPGLHVCVKWQR